MSALAAALILGAQSARVTAQQSPDELRQLVAPVALYPDELLAEVLAAATYPSDVDEAAQWLQQNANLTSDQVANAVDRMSWDSSVKALTEFPMVLASMDQNLSWTSALGDAYFNQPDDVMDAVQALRQAAVAAGTLQSNAQIRVSNQGGIIVIESVDADTVYVPTYDCWNGFGFPIDPWPNFVFAPGVARGSRILWNIGFHVVGAWGRVNWGWHNWAFDWGQRRVVFRHESYVSHSPSVINRRYAPPVRTPGGRGIAQPRPGPVAPPPAARGPARPGPVQGPPPPKPAAVPRPAAKTPADSRTDRGFPQPKPAAPPTGTHSGAMSDIGHGGAASSNSSRGQSSMGAHPAAPPARSAGPAQSTPPARSTPPATGRGRGRS